MIITKNDLKEERLTKEIIREIELLSDTLTNLNFEPIELKFKLVLVPDLKYQRGIYH
mgnify:CR=1 FL=1|jgi:hypothetical protein